MKFYFYSGVIFMLLLNLCYYNNLSGQESLLKAYSDRLEILKNEKHRIESFLSRLQDSINVYEKLVTNERIKKSGSGEIINVSKTIAYASIRESPSVTGKEILRLNPFTTVNIISYADNQYWKVEVNGTYGYVSDVLITKSSEMQKIIDGIENTYIRDTTAMKYLTNSKLKKDKERRLLIEKYGVDIGNKLANGYLWIGITKDMAIDAFGSPNNINRSNGSWGEREQWVYEKRYLYFENGKLSSWQD